MHALVMLQVMQHAECADPKAIHSPITRGGRYLGTRSYAPKVQGWVGVKDCL